MDKKWLALTFCLMVALEWGGYCSDICDDFDGTRSGRLLMAETIYQKKIDHFKSDPSTLKFFFFAQDFLMANPVKFLLMLGSWGRPDQSKNLCDNVDTNERLKDILAPLVTDYAKMYEDNSDGLCDAFIKSFTPDEYKKNLACFTGQSLLPPDPFLTHFNNRLIERPVWFFLNLTSKLGGGDEPSFPSFYAQANVPDDELTDAFVTNPEIQNRLEAIFYPFVRMSLNVKQSGMENVEPESEEDSNIQDATAHGIAATIAQLHLHQDYLTLLRGN